ncbi:hypothetical protein BESB_004200 [Besnoitia besnoiti]|uniref:Uncharacterized protein n=1 Tax=Besnoitia besnoiti TaxID=94643 RepID=A0A2A9MJI8_BESBE|nr:hypothetical protein BESB_004200 [Besnoitia besnoiti]PFH38079.1 hypothetical protein BESB_004200 [Besnoitia besnoiti]
MELRQREEALLDRTRQLTDLLYLAQRLRTSSSAPSAAAPAEHLSPAALLRSALVEPLRKLRTSRSIDECHRRQAFANSPRSPALTRSAPATPAAVLAGALEGRAPFAKALFADEGLEQRIHVCSSPSSAASSALSASLPRGGAAPTLLSVVGA